MNSWIAVVGAAGSSLLTLYIWFFESHAQNPRNLVYALAECVIISLAAFGVARILLTRSLEPKFGRIALLLPAGVWSLTFLSLGRVAAGHWSMGPMLIYAFLLPALLIPLGIAALVFGLIAVAKL